MEQGGGGEGGVGAFGGPPVGFPTESRIALDEAGEVLERVVAQGGVLRLVGVEGAEQGGGLGLAAGVQAEEVEHIVLERADLRGGEALGRGRVGHEGAEAGGLRFGEKGSVKGVDGFEAQGIG